MSCLSRAVLGRQLSGAARSERTSLVGVATITDDKALAIELVAFVLSSWAALRGLTQTAAVWFIGLDGLNGSRAPTLISPAWSMPGASRPAR